MNKTIAIFLAAACLAAPAHAESPEIAPVPNPGRWTVRLENPPKAEDPAGPRYEVSREVWVLGSSRYEVSTWSDGKQGQLFIIDKIGFRKSSVNSDVYVLDPAIGASPPPPVASWNEFAWIRPELLKGKETHAKKACALYEQQSETGLQRAWIEEDTRLPVALQIKDFVYLYQFEKAPDKLPSIDAVIGGAKQGYEAASKKLSVDLKPR